MPSAVTAYVLAVMVSPGWSRGVWLPGEVGGGNRGVPAHHLGGFLLRGVLAYQGAVRAMIAATITRPELAPVRPGLRFGLIDQALARWTAR
jgi:hypothetical protein